MTGKVKVDLYCFLPKNFVFCCFYKIHALFLSKSFVRDWKFLIWSKIEFKFTYGLLLPSILLLYLWFLDVYRLMKFRRYLCFQFFQFCGGWCLWVWLWSFHLCSTIFEVLEGRVVDFFNTTVRRFRGRREAPKSQNKFSKMWSEPIT